VERTASLIHLVDGTQEDVAEAWRTVRHELEAYGEELGDKTEFLVLSKVDALDDETRAAKKAELEAASGAKVREVSGVSGEGVTELLREAYALVRQRKGEAVAEEIAESGAEPESWAP
jgi:GTP-binding protein